MAADSEMGEETVVDSAVEDSAEEMEAATAEEEETEEMEEEMEEDSAVEETEEEMGGDSEEEARVEAKAEKAVDSVVDSEAAREEGEVKAAVMEEVETVDFVGERVTAEEDSVKVGMEMVKVVEGRVGAAATAEAWSGRGAEGTAEVAMEGVAAAGVVGEARTMVVWARAATRATVLVRAIPTTDSMGTAALVAATVRLATMTLARPTTAGAGVQRGPMARTQMVLGVQETTLSQIIRVAMSLAAVAVELPRSRTS